MISLTGSTSPSKDQAAYQESYPPYRALYPALVDQFKVIADITAAHSSGSEAE
jgi:hypothetical protein